MCRHKCEVSEGIGGAQKEELVLSYALTRVRIIADDSLLENVRLVIAKMIQHTRPSRRMGV